MSHLPTIQNKILQELNLHGLWEYSSIQQAYFNEKSNKIVNLLLHYCMPKAVNILCNHTRHTSMVQD